MHFNGFIDFTFQLVGDSSIKNFDSNLEVSNESLLLELMVKPVILSWGEGLSNIDQHSLQEFAF